MILTDKDGNIKIDGKVRSDEGYPVGLMGNLIKLICRCYYNR